MDNFTQLGLSASTLEVLESLGFEKPTPVQQQAIPILLQNDPIDFIGIAQTGTGKTAAFGLPLIELIAEDVKHTQALVMAPTRELSMQTAQQIVSFAKKSPALNIEVVYGGAAISNQIKALRGTVQIVVATPGRLMDLIKRKAIDLSHVKYVVLDEADEMLNMGFKEAIDEILAYTPKSRVTWLFSATMPTAIRKIVKKYMATPMEVAINAGERINKDISHQYVITKSSDRVTAVRRFLDMHTEMRGVMFCRTKRETQKISDELGSSGYNVEALHGDMSQGQREAVMKKFKRRSMQLLVATDVAARGIDVNDLTHVIHHSLPDQLENYTHRSGRTARAGKKGVSLALIGPRDMRSITELERKMNVKFEQVDLPTVTELKAGRIAHWAQLIANTKVDAEAEKILATVYDKFAELSKEDILKRLITTQLDHLTYQHKEVDDLNEPAQRPSSKRQDSKGDDRDRKHNRYFINLGSIDGLTKGDLIHILADTSGVDRKFYGDITMQKNCSFFDVESGHDKGFDKHFEGFEIEGRRIRVNKDNQRSSSERRPDRGGRSFGKRDGGKSGFSKNKGSRRPRVQRD